MKKEKTHIYYDQEGDILEVIIGKPTISSMKDLGSEIWARIDEKTGKTKGFLIVGFKKRVEEEFTNASIPIKLGITA